jgi:hypothetical protein
VPGPSSVQPSYGCTRSPDSFRAGTLRRAGTGRPSLGVGPRVVVDVARADVVVVATLVLEVAGGSDGEVGRAVAGGGTGDSVAVHAVRRPRPTAATMAGALHRYTSKG